MKMRPAPTGPQAPEPFELRRNGTYVVFRKVYQDVAAFRRYLADRCEGALRFRTTSLTRNWSQPR